MRLNPLDGNFLFQSTLSVRRATHAGAGRRKRPLISIHALRKESDGLGTMPKCFTCGFQSTLSVRRATQAV